ncbi:MAG: hypothetical protein DMD46_08175 [Gemmatimonadetes bacterium]|nr:MAG: hypothetical protein DMD46_08175 [Gemmatimonadota bacterium]
MRLVESVQRLHHGYHHGQDHGARGGRRTLRGPRQRRDEQRQRHGRRGYPEPHGHEHQRSLLHDRVRHRHPAPERYRRGGTLPETQPEARLPPDRHPHGQRLNRGDPDHPARFPARRRDVRDRLHKSARGDDAGQPTKSVLQSPAAVGLLGQYPDHRGSPGHRRVVARDGVECGGRVLEHHAVHSGARGGWIDSQRALSLPGAAAGSICRSARLGDDPRHLRGAAAHAERLPELTFEHVFADLGGIPANRLADTQGLAGLLLAAANAAGLNPAHPPVVTLGPLGVAAALVCHGGHVTLHGVPEAGLCFVDVAGLGAGGAGGGGGGGARPQRGLDVIIKRLGARETRIDARRRGPVTHAIHPEGS